MFDIGAGELLVLLVIGVLIFGPERLPKLAADAGRLVRELRKMAQGARSQLGPEFENINIADLNPRTFVAKHLLDGEDFSVDLDLMGDAKARKRPAPSQPSRSAAPGAPAGPSSVPVVPAQAPPTEPSGKPEHQRWDSDTT